jgi:hypothetical protein
VSRTGRYARRLARAVGLALLTAAVAAGVVGAAGGCVVVPQNRRKHLADPMMRFEEDALDAHRRQKFYTTREAAAGGDGMPAGGGCGCQ